MFWQTITFVRHINSIQSTLNDVTTTCVHETVVLFLMVLSGSIEWTNQDGRASTLWGLDQFTSHWATCITISQWHRPNDICCWQSGVVIPLLGRALGSDRSPNITGNIYWSYVEIFTFVIYSSHIPIFPITLHKKIHLGVGQWNLSQTSDWEGASPKCARLEGGLSQ